MARSELADLDTAELEVRLVESRKELFNLRFQTATGQLDNTARVGRVKKDVARILTYLRQRDVALTEAEYAEALSAEADRAAAGRAAEAAEASKGATAPAPGAGTAVAERGAHDTGADADADGSSDQSEEDEA